MNASACAIMSFNPHTDPTYKKTKSDRLINLRSVLTHSEFRFSMRYGGISVSATMADDCRCFRFKMIDYDKHPKRWVASIVTLTYEEEDAIFMEALKMAGYEPWYAPHMKMNIKYSCTGQIFYNKGALKYDLAGVSFSFIIPKWRLWRPHEEWVWCSESVTMLLQVVFKDFDVRADEQSPDDLVLNWGVYRSAA
jgi:hypothetical protein